MTEGFKLKADSGVKPMDFNSIKVGNKRLANDVTADVDAILAQVQSKRPVKKKDVLEALRKGDLKKMRQISEFFFKTNGIYSRLCRYMAYLYKYDWIVTPIRVDSKVQDKKVIEGWMKALMLLIIATSRLFLAILP